MFLKQVLKFSTPLRTTSLWTNNPHRTACPCFQEHWYMSYIDLLQRFELWNVSNEVIKLSTCGAITCLNQTSTTLHINCSNCKRPMSNKGWICDRCDWLGSRLAPRLFFFLLLLFLQPWLFALLLPQVQPVCQRVRSVPPCGQRTVCVVSGLQPRRTLGAHHELAQEQRTLPCRLRSPVWVHLKTRCFSGFFWPQADVFKNELLQTSDWVSASL